MLGQMARVGQNRIYTPYTTVHMVISLQKIPYMHRIYMVLANPANGKAKHIHTLTRTLTHTRALPAGSALKCTI